MSFMSPCLLLNSGMWFTFSVYRHGRPKHLETIWSWAELCKLPARPPILWTLQVTASMSPTEWKQAGDSLQGSEQSLQIECGKHGILWSDSNISEKLPIYCTVSMNWRSPSEYWTLPNALAKVTHDLGTALVSQDVCAGIPKSYVLIDSATDIGTKILGLLSTVG